MPARTTSADGFKPYRIEATGHDLTHILQEINSHAYEHLLLAEGDSWFDLFTPFISRHQPNLVAALRTRRQAALVDLSRIGDTAQEMVSGGQAIRTSHLLDAVPFDVWLVSAGGNDLKKIFTDLYGKAALSRRAGFKALSPAQARAVETPGLATDIFKKVIANILELISLRDASRSNQHTPMIFHGYDYLQPRPAGPEILPGVRGEPWIYPVLDANGMSSAAMLQAAKDVINAFNEELKHSLSGIEHVYFLDQRGTLALAEPGAAGASNDWSDEIHPLPAGFEKVAVRFWNPLLARLLRIT